MRNRPDRRRDQRERATVSPRVLTGRWRWSSRILLAVVVPILLLLAVEAGLRIAGFGYPTDLALEVSGRDSYGANLRFGWRFFPPAIARAPLFFSFPVRKPPDTYRIFVLGASAAQGYPDGAFGFSRILEVMLRERYPDVTFEVINTAIVATNSHVVLPIAREFAGYQPDLFIVYLGNNEIIGPYGIGSSATRPAGSLRAVRTGIMLRTTKLGQLLQQIIGKLSGRDEQLAQWRGMEQYAKNQIAAEDLRLARVYDHYRRNLTDICRATSGSGAATILSTVAVNLWGSAPFASLHRPDLDEADLARWEEQYEQGISAASAGRTAAAVAFFEQALRSDDRFADLHFRLGQALLAAGDTSLAHGSFFQARETDALRFRADNRLNDIVREVAAAHGTASTYLVDAARIFAESIRGPEAVRNEDLFHEHVHLTFAGNYLLARALYTQVEALLSPDIRARAVDRELPGRERCAELLAYTEWNEFRIVAQIHTLMGDHPFPNQLDHAQKYAQVAQHWQRLMDNATREAQQRTFEIYTRAVQERPDDLLLRANFYELLKDAGQRAAAAQQVDEILRTQPPIDWVEPEVPEGR